MFATHRHPEPFPHEPLGQKLCQTFPYRWQCILSENRPDVQWRTVTKYAMRPRNLWRYWKDESQLIGVRFDQTTNYGLIDIDRQSIYHPLNDPQALRRLLAALETIGICRTILIRSSWSEGLHIYIPLPVPIATFGLALALKQCLEAQEFTIAPNQLETFPNCKAWAKPGTYIEYNAHRLPLQPASGSLLLDDDLQPISDDLGRFFEQWDIAATGQDLPALKDAITVARLNNRTKRYRHPSIVEDWLTDLRTEIDQGWTAHGQTNHLLKTIGCYGVVFDGDELEPIVYSD
jgi:hypothetical protein